MSGFVIVWRAFGGDWYYGGERIKWASEWYARDKNRAMYHGSGDYTQRAVYRLFVEEAMCFPTEEAALAHIAAHPDTKFDMFAPVAIVPAPPLVLTQLDLYNTSIEADSES